MKLENLHAFLFGSVRRQLIVGVAAVHAVMMSLFVWDLTVRQQTMLLEQQTAQATALAQSVATSAAIWLAARDVTGVQEIVDAQRRYPELLYAMAVDNRGAILAHTDRGRLGQYLADLPPRPGLTVLQRSPALVDVATPALVGGRQVGWIRVGVGQQAAGSHLARITRDGLLYALAAILIGALLAGVMGKRLTRRLHAIQAVADAVGEGDTQLRAPVTGRDEAARLAHRFNQMLDTLVERERELRASHAALAESEAKYRTLFETMAQGAVVQDRSGRIISANPAAARILGLTLEQLLGRGSLDPRWRTVHEDGSPFPGASHPAMIALRDNRPVHDVTMGVFHPGENALRWILVSAIPRCHAGAAEPYEVFVTFTDITERKQAEAQTEDLNAMLEQKVRERTTQLEATIAELEAFAYSISHDLRAPLRGIDGFSQAMLEDYGDRLDASARDYLTRIRHGTQRMGQLIDDLLNLSRVTRAPLAPRRLDLSTMAQEILLRLQAEAPERKLHLKIQAGLKAMGDPGLLQLALENLLGNAWKYSSKTPQPRIEFGRTEQDGQPVFFVRDNGAGFDMAYADKLFGAFQRLHHPSEFEGTGIGLATVRRIIHRHGGRIWAEAAPGQGATFYFTLGNPAPTSEEPAQP